VDPDLVNEGAQDLTSYFQAKGYFGAKVQSQIQKQPSGVTVLYQIVKGHAAKWMRLSFTAMNIFLTKT